MTTGLQRIEDEKQQVHPLPDSLVSWVCPERPNILQLAIELPTPKNSKLKHPPLPQQVRLRHRC
jgi:hypothetical protein